MDKKEIKIQLAHLNCAVCAEKILEKINQLEDVEHVRLNFVEKRLHLSTSLSKEDLFIKLQDLVNDVEKGVIVQSDESEERLKENGSQRKLLLRMAIVVILLGWGAWHVTDYWQTIVLVAAYLLIGGDLLTTAFRQILKRNVFNEYFLLAIASLGAFAIGEQVEAVAVMLFFQLGEYLEGKALNKSRKSIRSLLDLNAQMAHVYQQGVLSDRDAKALVVGDLIMVRQGEQVPVDGRLADELGEFDTSAITGESLPRLAKFGEMVHSGSLNVGTPVRLTVTNTFDESTIGKILEMVEEAGMTKGKTERFITRFAQVYTPVVVGIALILATLPPLLEFGDFRTWLYRALVFLVCSCPCALVISVPLAYFAGLGYMSRQGVLLAGSHVMENLTRLEAVVFDKTGTLTDGRFQVQQIVPQQGYTVEMIHQWAASCEQYANHPIAKAICQAYQGKLMPVDNIEEKPGLGLSAQVGKDRFTCGNKRYLEEEQIHLEEMRQASLGTVVYLAKNGQYIGCLLVDDALKTDAKQAIDELKQLGIGKLAMLSGDLNKRVRAVGVALGITEVYGECLPKDKLALLKKIKKSLAGRGLLAFVGDGFNDAPALAQADVGIAMGTFGTDAATQVADVVIMSDEPSKVGTAIRFSQYTRRLVIENIVFIMVVKLVVLILASMGQANMWVAVFADVGVALIAIINAMRTYWCKPNLKK